MAVIQKIRDFFSHERAEDQKSQETNFLGGEYEIKPATVDFLDEIHRANQICFKRGESYSRKIFQYLLSSPKVLGYCAFTCDSKIVAFIFATLEDDGTGHISTIGVLPEHRKRGLARSLILHVEKMLVKKGVITVRLEVRVSNLPAQNLYEKLGYRTVQRLPNYYNDGEDGFLMVKSLV
ncbi:MAG: ribosomal protein S18-alanine N-acetyltransferase [Pyrinomonadaceae bacterium]|nr:ribosomal protein S18-alanine N-acetyltransferase [Pyrinomonadaceae bacterium]MCX7640131.1 ribosomal protein S18-alanine N-acetyltransferase [Pyrinomonadaceae bacterium]MDW8303281.1 ribosomal protein S18-alanine N-acetyltransferase [Acidobacteriota bacterium]